MAKRRTTGGMRTIPVAEAASEAHVQVIEVPAGGGLEVVVDVGDMAIPYTVAYAGRTVIKSLVDRREPVPLRPGSHMLTWAFAHTLKEWTHEIGVSINGGAVKVLEKKSEAKKDPDHSLGIALVRS